MFPGLGKTWYLFVSRFVMIQLFFAAKWILISEVTFESGQFFSWASNKTSRFQVLPTSNISMLRNLRNALRAIMLFSRPSHVTISRRTRSNMTVVFINSCDSSLNIMWVFMPPPPPPNPHTLFLWKLIIENTVTNSFAFPLSLLTWCDEMWDAWWESMFALLLLPPELTSPSATTYILYIFLWPASVRS